MTVPLSYDIVLFTGDGNDIHVSRDDLWKHFDAMNSDIMSSVDYALGAYLDYKTEQNNGNTDASQNPADTGQDQ